MLCVCTVRYKQCHSILWEIFKCQRRNSLTPHIQTVPLPVGYNMEDCHFLPTRSHLILQQNFCMICTKNELEKSIYPLFNGTAALSKGQPSSFYPPRTKFLTMALQHTHSLTAFSRQTNEKKNQVFFFNFFFASSSTVDCVVCLRFPFAVAACHLALCHICHIHPILILFAVFLCSSFHHLLLNIMLVILLMKHVVWLLCVFIVEAIVSYEPIITRRCQKREILLHVTHKFI